MSGHARPAISVVVPFGGSGADAAATLAGLGRLELRPGDEAIVADNVPGGSAALDGAGGAVAVVRATRERTSYHARNAGAERARNDWILFVDADCRPAPDLLDAFFAEPIGPRCGLAAGAVVPAPCQRGLIPAYARSRGHLRERHHLEARPEWPHSAGITGNLLVRREAWEEVGGFQEGVRSGADVELCWRVQDAGWELVHRPGAAVEHAHVERLREMLAQARRHAAGRRWVDGRYPGSFPRPRLARSLLRCAAGTVGWPLLGQPRRGLYKAIDAAWFLADAAGYAFGDNRAAQG